MSGTVHGTPFRSSRLDRGLTSSRLLDAGRFRDEAGVEVDRYQIPTTAEPFEWSGMDENGDPYQPGSYEFHVESYSNGSLINSSVASAYTEISEARLDGDEAILVTNTGQEILSTNVTGLRTPET